MVNVSSSKTGPAHEQDSFQNNARFPEDSSQEFHKIPPSYWGSAVGRKSPERLYTNTIPPQSQNLGLVAGCSVLGQAGVFQNINY